MNKLEFLIQELSYKINTNKQELFEECLNIRLSKAIEEYYKELDKAYTNLEIYNKEHNLRLFKKIKDIDDGK